MKFFSNNRVTFKSLCKPSSPIHHDIVINGFEEEPVILEDDPNRRLKEIEFTLRKTFSNKGHFYDALKESSVVKKN